jgi:hypothetical protein
MTQSKRKPMRAFQDVPLPVERRGQEGADRAREGDARPPAPPPMRQGRLENPRDRYIRRAESVQRVIMLVQFAYLIGAIHTGANLHGGRPTIFGEFDAKPALGWVIGLSWIVVIPMLQAMAPRRVR